MAGVLAILCCGYMLWGSLSDQARQLNLMPAQLGANWAALLSVLFGIIGVVVLSISAGKRQPVAGRGFQLVRLVSLSVLTVFVLGVLAMFLADVFYLKLSDIFEVLTDRPVVAAMRLSALTSLVTLALILLVALPAGYALSRYRFVGHAVVDAVIDMPMVVPPLIIGVSLLVFFQTPLGRWVSGAGLEFVYTVKGIILCQFFASASYGIRAAKAAFDGVDEDMEHLAMTLGCTRGQAFRKVALPLARNGLVAGGIIAWAHAVGLFGPLMIFAGTVRMKTEVMPTAIYLELSIGRIEAALAISVVMLAAAGVAMFLVPWLVPANRQVRR